MAMTGTPLRALSAFFVLAATVAPVVSPGAEPEAPGTAGKIPAELRVKPEQVFEFARKPVVTREGDRVTIRFASKGLCDATVAIEDGGGRILRHLASGVLGANAPAPFQKDSREQTLVWDGKDDRGEYVDDKDAVVVRVSLGLAPRYEKSLFWEPKKRVSVGGAGSAWTEDVLAGESTPSSSPWPAPSPWPCALRRAQGRRAAWRWSSCA